MDPRRALTSFARDTGHRDIENLDPCQIAKKRLAALYPPQVFPFVSNDGPAIEFRAPEQLTRHKQLAPGVISGLLERAEMPRNHDVLLHYIETVKPPVGKELVCFFLQSQRPGHIADLLPVDVGAADRSLYDRMLAYKPAIDAKAIGKLIVDLELPAVADIVLGDEPEAIQEQQEEEEQAVDRGIELASSDPVEWTAQHERELRLNPIMQAFKKTGNIAPQFPAHKTAKQILVLATAHDQDVAYRGLDPHVGRRQDKDRLLDARPVVVSGDHWIQVASVIDSLDRASVDAIIATHQAKDFLAWHGTRGMTKHQFVKSLFVSHGAPEGLNPRYLKRYPKGIGNAIIQHLK